MTAKTFPLALFSFALLAACEARIGKEDAADGGADRAAPAASAGKSLAEGKAEDGTFSLDAPGFDLKIAIPAGMAERAEADGDIIYPGSRISGMHIEADGGGAGERASGVELRFASPDDPAKVAAWYRASGAKGELAITSEARDGEAFVISGTQKGDGDPFTVRLGPKAGGGTDGRVTLTDRN